MMVKLQKLILISFAALFCGVLTCRAQQPPENEGDPPTRAARLSYFNGSVSMEPAGVNDWAPVEVNRPFTTGDYLYTDQKAVAELQLDSAVFRMGQVTSFGFLNLNDQIAQLKMTEGDLYFRVHDLAPSQVYEIDTPNAAISLLRAGVYRIHVNADSNTTVVSVREGQAEITGGGQAFTLNSEQSANLSGTDQLAYDIQQSPAPDSLDQWSMRRDDRAMQSASSRYVPPSMIGSSDLDQYGSWTPSSDYGPVWYPTQVPSGWAPYNTGHWAWIDPWGWTWVDAQPWGFAPSHYGRWVYWHDRWGWTPGPRGDDFERPLRPVYAPALVAWFGGSHWGVSVSIGGGEPSLGWVPLGYGEVYTPSYHCGPSYFRNVNVNNTRIVNNVNITNVYNTVYVQKNVYNQNFANARAPRGIVAVPASALSSGRPVQQFARPLPANAYQNMRASQVIAPAAVPQRTSVAPQLGSAPSRPNPAIFGRQIVARSAPPAKVVPFEQRQAFVQQHQGQPVNFAALRQQYQTQARPVAMARLAPQATPVVVHNGDHFGNGTPQAPAARGAVSYAPHTPNQPQGAQPPQQPQSAAPPVAHGLPPNRQPSPVTARENAPTAQPGYGQPHPASQVQPSREPAPNQAPNRPNTLQPPQQQQRAQQTYPQPRNEAPNRPGQLPQAPQPVYQRPEHGLPPNQQQNPRAEQSRQIDQRYEAPRQPAQAARPETPREPAATPRYEAPRQPEPTPRYEAPRQPEPQAEAPRPAAPAPHYEAPRQSAPVPRNEAPRPPEPHPEQHTAPPQPRPEPPHQEQHHSEPPHNDGNDHKSDDHSKK